MSLRSKALALKAAVVGSVLAPVLAFAQTAPTSAMEVLSQNAGTFAQDTKAVMFAGAGLIIGALLTAKLISMVINFFRRG